MKRAQLLAARLEKGWTQEKVAELLRVDPTTIRRWERGENSPQPLHLRRLCNIYGKTAQELGFEGLDSAEGQTALDAEQQGTLTPEPVEMANPLAEVPDEIYRVFRAKSLVLRLLGIVWRYPYGNARYQELQTALILELEDNSMNSDAISRRDALCLLVALPVEVCGLSALVPVFKRPIEEILTHCTAGITACWQLRKGKDLAFVSTMIATYLPTLQAITKTAPAPQRTVAADLLAQCYLLKSELARHMTSNKDAIFYAQQAEAYSEVADNQILRIRAIRELVSAHWYARRWEQTLHFAEKARYLLETAHIPIPQLVHSYVYAGLASTQAYCGQKQDALASLGQAHVAFFAQSPDEQTPVWIDNHSRANLVLNDGLTHLYLQMSREAFDSFGQIADSYADSEVIRVEALINQVMAEVNCDHQARDMQVCIDLWTKGIEGARVLQSEQWFQEAILAYTAMQAAWPGEQRVRALREYLTHW